MAMQKLPPALVNHPICRSYVRFDAKKGLLPFRLAWAAKVFIVDYVDLKGCHSVKNVC